MSTTAPEPAVTTGPVDANNNVNPEQTVQTAPTNQPDAAPTANHPQTGPAVNGEPKSDPKEPGADKAPISPQTGPAATQASSTTAPNPPAVPVASGAEAVQPSTTPTPPSVPAPISQPAVVNKLGPILCINPNKAVFSTAGGISKHLMINKSTDRLAIKIRSSNNFFFRVNPVYSFLDCQSVNELEVIRLAGGGAKQDKLQLIYVVCTDTDTDATKLFGLRAKVRSVILPITTTV